MLVSVAVVNRSSRPQPEVRAFVDAANEQLRKDLRPWNVDALVYLSGYVGPPSTTRKLYVWNDPQQLSEFGSMGRHEVAGGAYVGHVFINNALRRKRPWTVIGSHELIELLIDGGLNTYKYRPSKQEFWMLEPADPVEGQSYAVQGVPMANFVYPAFYEENSPGPYDHMRTVTAPFELAKTGYADVLKVVGNELTVYGVKPELTPASRTATRTLLTPWRNA